MHEALHRELQHRSNKAINNVRLWNTAQFTNELIILWSLTRRFLKRKIMYTIYLRDKNQHIYRKSTTADKSEAIRDFEMLVNRKELDGCKILAIIEYQDSPLAFHRFDVAADHPNNLRGKVFKIQ